MRVLGYSDEQIDGLFQKGVIYKEEAVDSLGEELTRLEADWRGFCMTSLS